MAKPILKWTGGKQSLLTELHEQLPEEYDTYHEPMIGGGSLFFSLEPEDAVISDVNTRLINMYQQIQDSPFEVLDILKVMDHPEAEPDERIKYAEENRKGKEIKNYYYQMREIFNNRPYDEDFHLGGEAALLIYLNRTCYNGLYRENQTGGFNVPIGQYDDPDWVMEDRIKKAATILEDTQIIEQDFGYSTDFTREKDLVYFDPPYKPMDSNTGFTKYTADDFTSEDQWDLMEVCRSLDNRGVKVMVSNTAAVRTLYEDLGFNVDEVYGKRSISQDASTRKPAKEIIATNY